ncbi:MAG: insulinase family protein [Myxococcaceae bacterium]|nr:insulinase family protein [Myxococcaceae bacterium]
MRALVFVAALAFACATPSTWAPVVVKVKPPTAWTPTEPPPPLAPIERRVPQVSTWKLKNGITVVVVEHHQRPVVRLRLVFPSGSSSDDPARAGATWFALSLLGMGRELMLPTGEVDHTEKTLRRTLLERGAAFRAGVDLDGAFVGIDGPARDSRALLELLADAVRNPRQGEQSFGVLLEEAADSLDERQISDPEVLSRAVLQLAFGDEEAGAPRGTAESISRLGWEEVVRRQAALVHPRGATLLVTGDVDPVGLRATLQSTFGAWSGGDGEPTAARPVRARPATRKSVTFLPRPGARTTLVCAARPLGDVPASDGVLRVVADVLGRRLTARLREEATLTYDVSTGLEFRVQNRGLVVCSRLPAAATEQGLQLLLAAVDHPSTPTPDEVELSRRQLTSFFERAQTSFDGVSGLWLGSLLTGRTFDSARTLAELRDVSVEQTAAAWKLVTASSAQYQLVTLGQRAPVEQAATALKLGRLRTPTLKQVETESRFGAD